ncbi:MAG: GNAT family N-acetyltransferase [Fidelibacterota bacterium]
MEHKYTLRDGAEMTVRNLTLDDVDLSHQFFLSLTDQERRYLRSDVTNIKHVRERIEATQTGNIIRRIAFIKNEVVGDGSLEIYTEEWKGGTGHLRLLIPEAYRHSDVGAVLLSDFYEVAKGRKLKHIITKLMRPQKDVIEMYEHLGFKIEGILPDYVVDRTGKEQDMVILTCSLENLQKVHDFVGSWIDDEHGTIGAGEM